MINVSDVYVQYGDRILLNRVSFVIGNRDRVGLVGRNGAGKSTTLKIISGNLRPDSGSIVRPTGSTLGFLHQEMTLPKGRTVMEETLKAFESIQELEDELKRMEEEITVRTDYESDSYSDLLERFALANDRYVMVGGQEMEAKAERVLKGLGFKARDFQQLTDTFSGGWQMRIELAKMLLQQPDYLLLDEPTNHLDIESIIWLEEFLKNYSGAIIIISHDKQFLDNITTRTVEIELGNAYDYKAPYSKYLALRAERREKMMAAFQNQQKVIAQREATINRFMAKATKTTMAQSMQKQLDKLERVELVEEDTAAMNLRFPPAPRSGQIAVKGTQVSKSYGDKVVLSAVDFVIERGEKIAFVGQNGQGKTTLAKMIVDQLAASGGTIELGHNVSIGYYAQNQADTLNQKLTLLETMELFSPPEMRTKLRAILGAFLFSGEDAEKKVSVLSGGERGRLALACMLLRPFNLLVLDEPTNHLDIITKDVLKQALLQYDGTMIVVSHDRDFLNDLTDRTLEFRDFKLHEYLGNIAYFLEKRQTDDMREIGKTSKLSAEATPNGHAAQVQTTIEANPEERKRISRLVQQAEKKISDLEAEIAKLEAEMAKDGFYESAQAEKTLKTYQDKQKQLEDAMTAWEAAAELAEQAGVA